MIVTVVLGVRFIALDSNFYIERYEKYEFAKELNVDKESLNESIVALLDYIKGDRDTIQVKIIKNGKEQDAFYEREILHMVDVRELYRNAIKVAIGAAIIGISIVFYFLLYDRKKTLSYLTYGFLLACGTVAVMLVFFGIWVATDFTSFWTWFHTIFFDNDLWLLDPRISFMINMLPEIIFNQLVLAVTFYFILVFVPLIAFSLWYQFKKAPIGFDQC